MLRYMTGGESHGKCMIAILDGMPSGMLIEARDIDRELARRKVGFGRGKRMTIEKDSIEILSGLRRSLTIGSPITLMIRNVDQSIDKLGFILDPRPGHADLAGALKYDHKDIRSVLERASARDTASRVAVGAIAKTLLKEFGIEVLSHVVMIGDVRADLAGLSYEKIKGMSERSDLRCADRNAAELMHSEIEDATAAGDTLGWIFEIIAKGVPVGLGSYSQWDRRLDGILAKAIMSIQAVKGVSFGLGFDYGFRRGSSAHDEIFYDKRRLFYRKTNFAGGVEGGVSNGEEIIIRAVMKPIATLKKPLASVNIKTKRAVRATVERADTCALPACGVVAEACVAFEIANAMLEKFGGDSIKEIKRNYKGYIEQIRRF